MNVDKVMGELKKKYPGKKVIVTDPDNPTEVICEIDPGEEKSEAIGVIDKTGLHYHKVSTEVYEVNKGELTMFIDGQKKVVREGERIELKPGMKHEAFGKETWIKVYSTPGWTLDDHILVRNEEEEVSREEFDKKV
jgi:mannose-6-phosphate isomerase-like protein (cupin superfamily)